MKAKLKKETITDIVKEVKKETIDIFYPTQNILFIGTYNKDNCKIENLWNSQYAIIDCAYLDINSDNFKGYHVKVDLKYTSIIKCEYENTDEFEDGEEGTCLKKTYLKDQKISVYNADKQEYLEWSPKQVKEYFQKTNMFIKEKK